MAIQLISAKWNYDISGSEKRYLVDSASEVGGLPEAPPDSRALVLDTGAAYIVNASGEWVETVIPAGGTGGGGGGDTPSEPKETLLYENANASGFAVDPTFGVPVLQVYPAPFTMSYGKAYRVIWDGAEYLVATQPFVALGAIAVGDLTGFGGAGNGEPFVFGYVPAQNAVVFAGLDEKTSHSIAVYEITDNQCKCETPIFAMEHMDGFTQAEGVTPAVYQKLLSVGKVFSETEIPRFLTVQWDGVFYACPVYSYDGMIFAGNSQFLDSTSTDTGIPFGIVFVGQAEQMTVLTTDLGTEHSVAIYHEIVECNGGGSGGGTVEGAATVTFMNGDAVYYTRPEIIGDDCPNPVTQGRVDAPKKESTAQYDYTYSGWSLTDGGTASTSALANITEDRTVYAAYTSAVRYYTITYYDSDGTTVLKTEQVAYGSKPTYVPEKSGASFTGWVPSLANVTGDASYAAQWEDKVTFAGGSWEDIIAIADAGQAEEYFAIGDKKDIVAENGAQIRLTIIGFQHDDLADGSGKAAMTIAVGTTDVNSSKYLTETFAMSSDWTEVATMIDNAYLSYFPEIVRSNVKTVNKPCANWLGAFEYELITVPFNLFTLSVEETKIDRYFAIEYKSEDWYKRAVKLGETYEWFNVNTNYNGMRPYNLTGARDWWLRQVGSSKADQTWYYNFGKGTGNYIYDMEVASNSTLKKLRFAFCI